MNRILLSVSAAICFMSLSAQALPLPKPGMTLQSLPATFTQDFNFEGIVALSNCSGSLIRLENARDTDKGLILTNGHCLEFGMPQPGQIVYGKPSKRTFRLFDANNDIVGKVTAT